MKKTLQEQYNLIKEGKGHKDIFLKEAKTLFPDMVRNAATFGEASSILLQRSIISENTWGVITKPANNPDWFSIFNENVNEAKAIEKAPTKEVVDLETKGFNYKDKSNIDNIYGQAFLIGYYAELKNPKNTDKTVDDLKGIVAKNLEKNPLFYVENGQFGTKDLGYTKDFPGLGNTKEVKGKYASSGMEPATDEKAPKSNTKDLGKNEYKSDMPKDVEEMSIKPQSSRGVQKMDIPGKEKKIKLAEAYMGIKGEKYQISKSGSKTIPYYVLEKPDGSAQIDMMFDTEEDAKKYANKKGLKISSKKGYNMEESLDENKLSSSKKKKAVAALFAHLQSAKSENDKEAEDEVRKAMKKIMDAKSEDEIIFILDEFGYKKEEIIDDILKENKSPQFKKGDKVTYLGYPGEITGVNTEMTGDITYNVLYDKGTGKTKASNIFNKGGEIKSLKEGNKEYFKPSIHKDKSNEKINEAKGSLKVEKQKDGKYYWTFTFESGKVEKWPNGFDTSADAQKDFIYRSKYLKESKQSIKAGDIVQKSYASTDEDYIKEFEVISIDKNGKATLKDTKTGKLTGIHVNDLYKASMNESKSNPEIDKLLKIINTKKAGSEYKKALMDLIAMAEKKSGKTVNTKKEALLALDYVEPSINEANKENGIDGAKKQLDALGVKYEISKTDKVKPFKAIYKPTNKSDEFYDKFEDIVDLFNLKGVVKSSMNEYGEDEFDRSPQMYSRGKSSREGYDEFDMEDEGPDYNNISDLEDELRRLIRFSNQYGSKGADAKIEQLKQRIAQLKNQVNEAVDMTELEFELKRIKKENPDKKVTYFFTKDNPKGYKIQIKESLKENQLRSLIHNIIKEELNEGYGMSLEDAKAEAKHISAQEGVVQHVEETEKGSGKYRVSDWYDSDLTVTSYNNGIES
jgi:hypothetical protein